MLTKFDDALGAGRRKYGLASGQCFRTGPTTPEGIDQLVYDELKHGTPRSQAYRDGVRDLLRAKILGATMPAPYDPGTAEFDARHAGIDHGHVVNRTLAPPKRKNS